MARRDVDAFATFYDRTRARVFGLVTRVLRDPGYSEETTQDIYLQVWRTADSYDPSAGSPLAWLMTLAHRRAVDRVRSEQAASQRESRYGAANVDPPSDQVADSVILRDERRQVADCLGSLTDAQRECIQLAYYDGLTYVQVSERLSANLATIKSRMRDAIRGLRRCLGIDMTEPTDPDLIALATPYALHAVPETELADIERRVAAAPPDVAQAFDDEVRAVRETMAAVSAATAVEPPHQLRDRLLTEVSSDPVRGVAPETLADHRAGGRGRAGHRARRARGREWRCGRHPARRPPSRCSPLPTCGLCPARFRAAARRRWCSPARRTPACW